MFTDYLLTLPGLTLPAAERLTSGRRVWKCAISNLGCQHVATVSPLSDQWRRWTDRQTDRQTECNERCAASDVTRGSGLHWTNDHLEKAEKVGVMTTKKVHHFFEVKIRVTPSVTAPGGTNLSDATVRGHLITLIPRADNLRLTTWPLNWTRVFSKPTGLDVTNSGILLTICLSVKNFEHITLDSNITCAHSRISCYVWSKVRTVLSSTCDFQVNKHIRDILE